jgi:hypothetical protein
MFLEDWGQGWNWKRGWKKKGEVPVGVGLDKKCKIRSPTLLKPNPGALRLGADCRVPELMEGSEGGGGGGGSYQMKNEPKS